MENIDEVKKAEAHLIQAEAELEDAENAERNALHDIKTAEDELREAESCSPEIHFNVDGEDFETRRRDWTPNQIIVEFGKKDPATNYLVQIQGDHKVSYQGKGNEEIKLHDGERFQIVSTGPTPVSAW